MEQLADIILGLLKSANIVLMPILTGGRGYGDKV